MNEIPKNLLNRACGPLTDMPANGPSPTLAPDGASAHSISLIKLPVMAAGTAALQFAHPSSAVGVNIMLIGLGPHADRTYVPHIAELRALGLNVHLRVVAELESARAAVSARTKKHGPNQPDDMVFIAPTCPYAMDAKTEIVLNRLVAKHQINAVIVSTPPEAHFAYADWGLRNGISVLLDKPVTSRPNAVSSREAARGIREDIRLLIARYRETKKRHRICCVVNAQRRFHRLFDFMRKMVEEVRDITGHAVTRISAAHGDGQFRLPSELIDIAYHGYRGGNGKLSHSGYHLADMICRLFAAGWTDESKPSHMLVQSSFVQPDALLMNMPRDRFLQLFGERYNEYSHYSDEELSQVASRMGEVDANISMEFLRKGRLTATASMDLQHNTVSARSWLEPGENLYKMNGRMKREFWRVDSGPFQSIRLETIQAEDKHDGPGVKGIGIGQPNHLQIAVVRNEKLLGTGKRLEIISGSELRDDNTKLHSERAKMAALSEFIDFVQGKIAHEELTSDLQDHLLSASVMSAAYESHVLRQQRGTGAGWIKLKL